MTTLFKNKCKSPDQTLGHTYSELSAWWFCIWSLQSSSRVCVGIYGLTYSLYHPRGSELWVRSTSAPKSNLNQTYFSKLANHQIRHQATHKVSCQPGDCKWQFQSSSWVGVGIYGLTHSLYHPWGCSVMIDTSTHVSWCNAFQGWSYL